MRIKPFKNYFALNIMYTNFTNKETNIWINFFYAHWHEY